MRGRNRYLRLSVYTTPGIPVRLLIVSRRSAIVFLMSTFLSSSAPVCEARALCETGDLGEGSE